MAIIKMSNSGIKNVGNTRYNSAGADILPLTPLNISATDVGTGRAYNNGAATVSFTPNPSGGAATSYTAISSPGEFTTTGTSSPLTVTGLQSGVAYTFTVRSNNANGNSSYSSASNSITATTVPQAPTIGTATRSSSTQVNITFTSADTGGKAITSYTAVSNPGVGLSTSGTASPVTASGTFATDQAYTFTLAAVNANGTSIASSSSNSVIPKLFGFITWGGPYNSYTNSISLDQSNNIYTAGEHPDFQNKQCIITKFNSSGVRSWERSFGSTVSGNNEEGRGIATDSSGNVYVASIGYTGSSYIGSFLAKYDTNGTIQWQKNITAGGEALNFYSIKLDSSNNIYVCGIVMSSGVQCGLLIKFDSTGAILWQRRYGGTSGQDLLFYDISLDSSNNIYVCGNVARSGLGIDALLVKYDNSGTIQWERALSSNLNDWFYRIAIDSSSNIYTVGGTAVTGDSSSILIAKYNSSGTLQWQRMLSSANTDNGYGVGVDSSSNVYVVGYTDQTGGSTEFNAVVAKYNTSGTLQWQRQLKTSPASGWQMPFYSVTTSSGNTYFTGRAKSNYTLVAGVSGDGSGAGTYNIGGTNYVYEASSLTQTTTSLSSVNLSLPFATPTCSIADSTQNDFTVSSSYNNGSIG